MRCGSDEWTWVSYSGCSNCVTPVSEEVLDHIRRTDYDGQGKSQAQEAADSMYVVAWGMLSIGVMLLIIIGIVLATR